MACFSLPSLYSFLIGFFFCFTSASFLFSASQNKLIAKKFNWQVVQTEHFNLHYYPGAERYLIPVANDLEKAYDRVTQSLEMTIPERSNFFLFLNHNDFEQNNIVSVGEGTGGVTEAFKDRFLVFNDGSQRWLEHVIVHEFVHVAQFHLLYSGFWKSIRLLKSVLYPLWFMEGMAEYFSEEIDGVQREMVLRDAVTSKKLIPLTMLHGFNHVKPHQTTLAYKTGNAALNFIAQEYGKEKIRILLQNVSEKFDMIAALQETIGLTLSEFDSKFREFLEEKYEEEAEVLKEPDFYGEALTRSDLLYPVFNSNPTFFPDGKRCLYLSDRDGFTEIFLYDFSLSRSLSLDIQKKFPERVENIHKDGSALSVSPDGQTILFAGESKQKDYLYLFDMKRDQLKKISFPLDGVSSPQFSPDGRRILFIGMKDGVKDIFIANKDGQELKQLSDTFEEENFVRFFPDGKTIIFSRESVRLTTPTKYEYHLWTLSLETKKESQLTVVGGKEIQPSISPSGEEVLFVSDVTGIPNLYKILLAGGKPVQLTDVIGGNFFPTYSPNGKEILFVSHRQGEQQIYRTSQNHLVSVSKNLQLHSAEPSPSVESKNQDSLFKHSILKGEGGPYSFKASTDFFFPIFFYSSTDGLFTSAYWQASEMLGNHQLQAAVTYASALNFLNYQIFYSYLKFRPQLFIGFLGDTQRNVIVTSRENRREDAQLIGLNYPINRFDKIQIRFLTTQRRFSFLDDSFVTSRPIGNENVATLSFFRDLSRGRYLETTSGYRIETSYSESNRGLGSSLDYRNFFLTTHQFFPIQKESVLAFRSLSGASFGSDRQFFRTGGSDLLRGYGRFDTNSSASYFIISNLELRVPLLFNLDYHLWFIFPDLLFKNVYGAVFTDNGVLWNSRDQLLNSKIGDLKNSVGLGLRFQTFVLQTFPLILQIDWAHRTSNGEQTFYLSLGPNF